MMLKLTASERSAIDLVLDRAAASELSGAASINGGAGSAATGPLQRLLDLLSTLPEQEPSSDLVTRTLARIEQSTTTFSATSNFLSTLSAHPAQ